MSLRAFFVSTQASLIALLSSTAASASAPAPVESRPRIDVVFVLDTTGSMSGLIEGAKQKIWSIASRIAEARGEPDVRMGLVAYRDRGDEYVTRTQDLSADLDAIYGRLRAFRAGGGGDGPESVNQALHEAVTTMSWRGGPDVYRVIFLVGDAPPHLDYQDDVPYRTTLALAASRGVVVNAIQCGGHAETTPIWREIATRGEGEYAQIDADGGMVAIATPLDDELARLGEELAETALPWGSAEEQALLERKLEGAVASAPSVAADRLAYLGKSGGRLASGRGDLVDAVAAGAVDPAVVDEQDLPAEMHGLDDDGKREYVARRQQVRRDVQHRIDSLVKKRDAYVRSEQERLEREGRGHGFDARVFEAVKRQAAAAGIVYE